MNRMMIYFATIFQKLTKPPDKRAQDVATEQARTAIEAMKESSRRLQSTAERIAKARGM